MGRQAGASTEKRASWPVLVFLLAMVVTITACEALPRFSVGPTVAANPWLADERIAQAVEFRSKFGLRADVAWARQVAAMDDAIFEYEIPLTPEEFALLKDRSDSIDAMLTAANVYGALHPDEWAGASQDVRHGGVVARFTDNIAEHQAALWASLGPDAKLRVVRVRWSPTELRELNMRIAKDLGPGSWLLDHAIAPLSLGVDEIINQVELEVSSKRTDLDPLLESHYEAAGMITVTSDGTGVEYDIALCTDANS